ncbi:MAG: hydrogenase/urease maturation nickel metallochaperone HypA [Phycisphaerae bacterium]
MHEHQLARDIWPELEKVARENNLSKVTHLILDIGMLHAVDPEFLLHSFEHVFESTSFEGTKVEINIIEPGQNIPAENSGPALATGRELIIRKLIGE